MDSQRIYSGGQLELSPAFEADRDRTDGGAAAREAAMQLQLST